MSKQKFTPRAGIQEKERHPDENGNILLPIQPTMSYELYLWLKERKKKEHRSYASIVVMQLEKYKEQCEKLGL